MVGNGSNLPITHTGSISLPSNSRTLLLNNVLCVPEIKKNLISANKLCKTNNVMIQLCPYDFQVKDLHTGTTLLNGKANKGVYEWPISFSPNTSQNKVSAFSCIKTSSTDWHSRLGHPNSSTLRFMLSRFSLPTSSSLSSTLFCNSCSTNKSHKLPFSTSTLKSTCPLDIIFSDVWTSPVLSVDGFKYYVIFVDHFTKYTWLYPLKTKSQVAHIFPVFKTLVENRFKTKITTLYSDNGGEFLALKEFLSEYGISHHTSPPHTPEHNGMAERKHRHIVETGLSLLTHANIPNSYWTYSFATTVYLINRLTTPNISNQSPFHALFRSEPNYTKLRSFGCLCYPWIRPYGNNKFSPRSTACVFVGYSLTQSAYLCLEVATSRVYVSRHVDFVESVFPFSTLHKNISASSLENSTTSNSSSASLTLVFNRSLYFNTSQCTDPSPADLVSSSATQESSTASQQQQSSTTTHISEAEHSVSSTPADLSTTVSTPSTEPNNHSMVTRAKNNIRKPNPKYGLTAILHEVEPANHVQALKDEKWRRYISEEADAFIRNDTFELVDRSQAKNIVGNMWLFRIKRNPDGTVRCYKSRLVAKGNHQRPGIDFYETYSPVVKHATIRLVLATAVAHGWPLLQLDVNNAFLQGPLDEEVYMLQPPGMIDKDKPNHVWKLKKVVYGLKQAPRAWYQALKDFLIIIGFKNSLADASLFILQTGSSFIYILIYVDDIVITGSHAQELQKVTTKLAAKFSLKELGELSYFLGMEATRTEKGLHLTQTKYITDLLRRAKMDDAKPVATPMSSTQVLTLNSGDLLSDRSEYRVIVGSLQYLGLTRPDIAFHVNRLSQFMHQPTSTHWEAAKRVLRYLAGTADKGIFFSANTPFNLHAYSDADWAGDHDDYNSTGAYIVYLGRQPISWSAKKQGGVARSSTEAEYRALTEAAAELMWVQSVMSELGIKSTDTPVLYCDNIGATYLSANPVFHSRMKHLALDYHFVRQQVQAKKLRVTHISSVDQLADALTKPLARSRFETLTSKIELCKRRPS